MKKKQMKLVLLFVLILANLAPLATILAAGPVLDEPTPPYEKVAAKKGDWYYDQMVYDDQSNLISGYAGGYTSQAKDRMFRFSLAERTVLTTISIPYKGDVKENLSLVLTDETGNVYKGFTVERSNPELFSVAEGTSPEEIAKLLNTIVTFKAPGAFILPPGRYTAVLDGQSVPVDAYLVKGYLYSAYEAYYDAREEWAAASQGREKTSTRLGNSELFVLLDKFIGQKRTEEAFDNQKQSDVFLPPTFTLDNVYVLNKVVLETVNGGKGAVPGTISILDASGKILGSFAAQGGSIGSVPNAMWIAAPDLKLPAGTYTIGMSDPAVLSYDQDGMGIFSVEATVPAQPATDFTGTYRINLDAFKTGTLMGPVSGGGEKSFSLTDHEVCIIDKGSTLEAVTKYKGAPYSLELAVVQREENKVVTEASFGTLIPPDSSISATAQVVFVKESGGRIATSMTADALYTRGTFFEGDRNTYTATMNGYRISDQLAPFVIAALKQAGGVGNVPGPDNGTQAAVGLLFPPLVGLAVNLIQEAQKSRKAKSAGKRPHDKSWYAGQFPGKSDEELAWIMLGDALGASGGDEEDAVSVSDGEPSVGSDAGLEETSGFEPEESISEEDLGFGKPDVPEDKPEQPAPPDASQPQTPPPAAPAEPETMELITSPNGATSLFVKDPVTGKWTDVENGAELDVSRYPQSAEDMMADRAFNDAEFEKMSRGETRYDKELRADAALRKENLAHENYKDKIRDKYGVGTDAEAVDRISTYNGINQRLSEGYRGRGNLLAGAELGAVIISTAADTGIDMLAPITPGGEAVQKAYYITKGIASKTAEKGVTAGSVLEGAITGTSDAYTKTPGLGGLEKAAGRFGGEFVGKTVGGYVDGEDLGDAATKAFNSGFNKASVGYVSDKLAGTKPNLMDNFGEMKYTTAKTIISNTGRYVAGKTGSSALNYTYVKPNLKVL